LAKPHLGGGRPSKLKSADFADLADRIKALENKRDPSDNLDDIRQQTLATLAVASSSHFRLGQNLYRFREALEWGCWYSILDEMARTVQISRRTLLEIVERYEKVKDAPPEVLDAMLIAGINPAAPRKRDVLAAAVGNWVAGVPSEQAVSQAEELTKRHRAPPSTFPDEKLSKREKARFEFRVALRKFLAEIPENEKIGELKTTLGEEITVLLGDKAEAFVVEPLQSTIGLSGRRRPEPEPQPQPALSEAEVLALAQAAFFGDQPLVLSEADMAAIEQLVQKRIASVLESRTK